MRRKCFHDLRFWLLLAACLSFLSALVVPPRATTRDAVDILFVVDITGSMNTRDYVEDGKPVSRLEKVRTILTKALADLPCQSHVALALFAERRIFLLFDPVEVCSNFGAIAGSIAALDWREAWSGDSYIAKGLYKAIPLAGELHTDLVFLTDGQEAPPLPWSGGPPFEGKPGAVKGLIVGVGGYTLSPIPKFDDRGEQVGFYGEDDVLQESRFGLPPPGAEKREGYNARNAPFGAGAGSNNEHLSSVRQSYLEELAQKTGMAYTHLVDESALLDALKTHATPHPVPAQIERAPYIAGFGLLCFVGVFLVPYLLELGRLIQRSRGDRPDRPPLDRSAARTGQIRPASLWLSARLPGSGDLPPLGP